MENNRIMPTGEANIRRWLNTNHSEAPRNLDSVLAEMISSEFGTTWETARRYIHSWRNERGAPRFHLSTVVSVVTGRQVSVDGIGGTASLIEHVLGAPNIGPMELMARAEEAERAITAQLPELEKVKSQEATQELDRMIGSSIDREFRAAAAKTWVYWLRNKFGLRSEYLIIQSHGKDKQPVPSQVH